MPSPPDIVGELARAEARLAELDSEREHLRSRIDALRSATEAQPPAPAPAITVAPRRRARPLVHVREEVAWLRVRGASGAAGCWIPAHVLQPRSVKPHEPAIVHVPEWLPRSDLPRVGLESGGHRGRDGGGADDREALASRLRPRSTAEDRVGEESDQHDSRRSTRPPRRGSSRRSAARSAGSLRPGRGRIRRDAGRADGPVVRRALTSSRRASTRSWPPPASSPAPTPTSGPPRSSSSSALQDERRRQARVGRRRALDQPLGSDTRSVRSVAGRTCGKESRCLKPLGSTR